MAVFIFLIILACVALWFILSFLYKPIGNFIKSIFDDAVEAMDGFNDLVNSINDTEEKDSTERDDE